LSRRRKRKNKERERERERARESENDKQNAGHALDQEKKKTPTRPLFPPPPKRFFE